MSKVHNGVLIPEGMHDAPEHQLDTFATKVKAGNSAFIAAYWALEDKAAELGIELPS